jgi:hypothetical protein
MIEIIDKTGTIYHLNPAHIRTLTFGKGVIIVTFRDNRQEPLKVKATEINIV